VDVARILCKTVDELKNTDITARALEVLAESRVREVRMIGRRGPVQAAFTPPEMKELGELEDCDLVVDPRELELNDASRAELEVLKWREAQKNYDLLKSAAAKAPGAKSRRLVIQFYRARRSWSGRRAWMASCWRRTRSPASRGNRKPPGTGITELIPCGVLFRSVGYRGVPLANVPFDEKNGVIPNTEGRVMNGAVPVPGLYAAGWIKRGPSGIIGTNKPDSFETVKSLLADLPSLGALRRAVARGAGGISARPWRPRGQLRRLAPDRCGGSGARLCRRQTARKIPQRRRDAGSVAGKMNL
jgi:ferredoxin--NADP+ reductase